MAPEAQSPARSPGSQDSSGSSSASEISDVRERMALMRRWMSEFSPADRLTAFQALQVKSPPIARSAFVGSPRL